MAVSSQEPSCESQTDRYPLLMERPENYENHEHIVDIVSAGDASSSSSSDEDSAHVSNPTHHENRPLTDAWVPISQSSPSSSDVSESRNSSIITRAHGPGRRRWSPFNSGLWISIEIFFTTSLIVASIVVLSLSRDEKPQTPLFAWVVGYAAGCAASLPILFWRYLRRNHDGEQGLNHMLQGSSQGSTTLESNSYITISLTRSAAEENLPDASTNTWNGHTMGASNARLSILADYYKMALDCFFAVWFVVGNVWIFGGHSSFTAAPNLYRLCIVFLTFSCIGYAMPFILCAMICCCLPCIISILGHGDLSQVRGASAESINALPTYKFKLKKNGSANSGEISSGVEGGVVGAGTEKERAISGEDAVCCICLTRYADDDELRELPCSHFFHSECVDKWLKINASCPLCKCEVGENTGSLPSSSNSAQQR